MTDEHPPVVSIPDEIVSYADDLTAAVEAYLRAEGIIEEAYHLQGATLKLVPGDGLKLTNYSVSRTVVAPEE